MTWDYRVIVKDGSYYIYEVYYDDDGNPGAFTEDPVSPFGESLEELKEDLKHFSDALSLPVLDYSELEKLFTGKSESEKRKTKYS